MKQILKTSLLLGLFCSLAFAPLLNAQGGNPAVQQKVEAFKQAQAMNKQALQHYSWLETTQLSLKGEVKSTKVEQCQYGPNGQVQKTVVSQPPPPPQKRGVRGRVVEKKVDEMKDYMQQAVALIKQYVPPSPDKLKAAASAGNASINPDGRRSCSTAIQELSAERRLFNSWFGPKHKYACTSECEQLPGRSQRRGDTRSEFPDSSRRHKLFCQQSSQCGRQTDRGQHY